MSDERRLPMKELAKRINVHLKRFEADPRVNLWDGGKVGGTTPYYEAGAFYVGGRYVGVRYISYQGVTNLTRAEATSYLAWLDAGNIGNHYAHLRAERTITRPR